jgi:hypothetical protein
MITNEKSGITGWNVLKPPDFNFKVVFKTKSKKWFPTSEHLQLEAEFVILVSIALNEIGTTLLKRAERVDET